MNQNYFTQT